MSADSEKFRMLLKLLLALTLMALAGCKGAIGFQTGLSDAEANEIIAVLQDDGISVQKQSGKAGIALSIDAQDMSRATALLASKGLPRRRQVRLGEVFKKEGLISSPMEERARYVYALSQELEHTLLQIDDVIVARVHVVLPEKIAPGEPMQPSSAAVFIKHGPGLDADLILPQLRRLVARSIPGLGSHAREKVSVVFVPSTEVARKPSGRGDQTVLIGLLAIGFSLIGLAVLGAVYYRQIEFSSLRKLMKFN